MKPPYDITPGILGLISAISENIGRLDASFLDKPSPKLRKQNRIRTIHSTLSIEGNQLSEAQVTAIIDNKRVLGPEKDVQEVLNAIDVYNKLDKWKAGSERSFLAAHQQLMAGLMKDPGKYRTRGVGIVKGKSVKHIAPPAENIRFLMKALFGYLRSTRDPTLIKACVFHYEMECIHPFLDGNGRMGRLWQTVILMEQYPLFAHLPLETLISKDQKHYYKALSDSDKQGRSNIFIEYMLDVINKALINLLGQKAIVMTMMDRLSYFLQNAPNPFTRKDYMQTFKNISTATASRDLTTAVEKGLLTRKGDRNKTVYTYRKHPRAV